MKKNKLTKKITALLLAASLMISVAACSSNNNSDDEEEEETTTVETTTETTTTTTEETTTEETTAEETTTTLIDDPALADYSDDEVRSWASWYISNGYDIEYMDFEAGESWWGNGTNIVEGFAAAGPGANIFTLDYVMKFPDYVAADAFLNELDGSDFGTVVRSENGDGTCTFEIAGGIYTGSLSANNVVEMLHCPVPSGSCLREISEETIFRKITKALGK